MANKSQKNLSKKTANVPTQDGFEPNKMGLAVAALAVTILVLVAVIAVYGY